MCTKAVILAAGLGTRMRRDEAGAALTPAQARMAAAGLKAMIPFDRPFLDYSLNSLADAGIQRVCLVIGSEHAQVRDYYSRLRCQRLGIEFAVQPAQLGTANALTYAEDFAKDDDLLVLNGDNWYPTAALRSLREWPGNAVVGFNRNALLDKSNITVDRFSAFAVIVQDAEGFLIDMIEKPDASAMRGLGASGSIHSALISMNCWRFRRSIFPACRSISPSPRGELELPDAVLHAIRELNERYLVIPSDEGVLDLSSRGDIDGVRRRLANVQVRL
jgi:dTDP-glucose pyrophosphorylase